MKPGQVESDEELKKKEAKLQAQEHAQKFALRHRGWVYEIPDWKAKYLTMAQSGLLEDEEKPAEAQTQDEATESEPAVAPGHPVDPNAGAGQ